MSAALSTTTKIKGYCVQCGSLCPAVFHVRDGILTKAEPDREHPNSNPLCPKGAAAPELVYDKQRLKHPMRRTRPKGEPDPGWERITWDEALDTIASRLNEIKAEFGPQSVVFNRPGPGGSPSSDYNDWVSRLAHALGTPNVLATGHVCQWHRDTGSTYTYGRGGIGVPEFEQAACILIWGTNPQATSRTRHRAIQRAQARGAKLIVIDPRRTETAARADLWLQIRPGTDGALALSMINTLIDEGLYDNEFTREWTTAPFLVRGDNGDLLRAGELSGREGQPGYVVWDTASQSPRAHDDPSVDAALKGSYTVTLAGGKGLACDTVFERLTELARQYPAGRGAEICGLAEEQIKQAARMLATVRPACYFTYNGLEQHTNATQTNQAICTLYALTGNYDAPGGNVIYPPVPTNPVQGAEFLSPEMRRKRLAAQERPLGPAGVPGSVQAYEVFRAIESATPYPIKAMVAFGGNIITANCPSPTGRDALEKLDFYAHVDLFPTPSALLADIVLPAATTYEGWFVRAGFRESPKAYHHLQLREQVIAPLYESRPDMEIIFELAKRLGLGDRFWDGDIESAFAHQIAPSGVTVEELRRSPGGISISMPLEYRKHLTIDPETGKPRGFDTPSGRMELYSQVFKEQGYDPLPIYREPALSPLSTPDLAEEYPLILTCSKVLQFCHGQHRSLPSLRKAIPYPYLEIHPLRAKELGVGDGDWVAVETPQGSIQLKARLTDKVAPNVVCTQEGWWQSCPELGLPGFDPYSPEGANLNVLYPFDNIDPISGSLPYKAFLCRVRKL